MKHSSTTLTWIHPDFHVVCKLPDDTPLAKIYKLGAEFFSKERPVEFQTDFQWEDVRIDRTILA